MGWWSANILGGDEPLDQLHLLQKALRMGDGPVIDTSERMGRQKLMDEFLQKASPVGRQVAGHMIMKSGAEMTEEQKNKILEGIEADQWTKEEGTDSERGKIMAEFRTKISGYFASAHPHAEKVAYIVHFVGKIDETRRGLQEAADMAAEIDSPKLSSDIRKAQFVLEKMSENLSKKIEKSKIRQKNPVMEQKA